MDEQKKEETTNDTEIVVPENTEDESTVSSLEITGSNVVDTAAEVEMEVAKEESALVSESETGEVAAVATAKKPFNYKVYAGAVLAILTISLGLLFVLEKEGRISTGLFSSVIEKMESRKPVAKVNGITITKGEYDSSFSQLMQMAGAQGANVSDATLVEALKSQTIDTLVNGEILRQAAVAAGKTVTAEQIDGRYTEIETGLGGAEALNAKMKEFGVDAKSLRRDIENEFLIQAYFVDNKIGADYIEVTEEEITALYEQAKAASADIPPLEEVKEQVAAQIKSDKEQTQINDLLQKLRIEAEVEVLL